MLSDAPRRDAAPLSQGERLTLIALLLLGFALLLYRFPAVPVGLHQDEMSEAYESLALLRTGADRWGYHLPVYFLSWGSGQNVLQSYLNIPFIAALGLTRLSARLLPMLLGGLATLPVFFFAVRRWYGNRTALLALAFLALSPWHIMLSRWGIENSITPFFAALGLWTYGLAAESRSPWRIVPCFVPFALTMYTYGVPILVLPPLVLLLLWLAWPTVREVWPLWLAAVALFTVLVSPLAYFTLKNYVLKRDLAFERYLPFSVPLLPLSRLDQARDDTIGSSVLHHNLKFFAKQMPDIRANSFHWPWYQLPDGHSVQTVVYVLFGFALVVLLWRSLRARRPLEPFVPWMLSGVLVYVSVPLNTSRAGIFFLPLLALASYGFFFLLERLRSPGVRRGACAVLAILVLIPTAFFCREYYGPKYASALAQSFYPHMPQALATAERIAGPNQPIYISQHIGLNYIDVLFMDNVSPVVFQHAGVTWGNPDFGQFRFREKEVPEIPHPFIYLLPDWQALHKYPKEIPICPQLHELANFDELRVGVCP